MRNSSDIFNLKELKEGDTNGTQMFSVNGTCQLTKLCRRRNLHAASSSFEYGSSTSYKNSSGLPAVHKGTGDYTKSKSDENIDIIEDIEDLQLGEEEFNSSEENISKSSADIDDEKDLSEKGTPKTTPSKKKSPVFKKITPDNKKEEKVSESAMSRNPLTGAGVETETPKKAKKGPNKNPKWVW